MNATWANKDDDRDEKPSSDDAQSGQVRFAWYAQGFSDPLGDRLLLFDNTSGAPLELLRLRPELSCVPGFESLVRQRAGDLRNFEDPRFARVCRVDRLPDPGGGLAVVSMGTQGQRLSEILHLAEQRHLQPTGDIVRRLVIEIVAAVASFHVGGDGAAHGALGPERVVVTPDGQLLVTEYVLGSALAQVPLGRSAFWRDLRVAVPIDPDVQPFEQRTDVLQAGTIALALVLGRSLAEDDYPDRLTELVAEADDRLLLGGWGKLAEPFRDWLLRMLQLDRQRAFSDGIEAARALQELMTLDARARFGAGAVEAFIRACTRRQGALQGSGSGGREDAAVHRVLPPANGSATGELGPFAGTLPEPGEQPGGRVAAALPSAAGLMLPAGEADQQAKGTIRSRWKQTALILLAILAVAEALFIGARLLSTPHVAAPSTAIVNVDSNPGQATVLADGKPVGVTPIRLELHAGRHVLEVSAGDRRRTFPVTAAAGTTTSHYVDLPPAPPPGGTLRVVTGPPGGRVLVDGQARGVSPLVVTGLVAGQHEIVVESPEGGRVRQAVDIEQNSTASLFVPLPGAGAPASGWLTIAAPLELNVYENGDLIGTSKSARIMLAAGRHDLQLVADEVAFRTTREVRVPVGKTVTVDVAVPSARLAINALPWAEVLIDNKRVGETPLSGVAVPIGRHVVTFRHPELGERSVEYLVTLQGPTRVSVDLRK